MVELIGRQFGFEFTNPPDTILEDSPTTFNWSVPVEITWTTNLDSYHIQLRKGNNGSDPSPIVIFSKGASDAEQGEFLWNISEFNTAASNMFEAPESPYTLATADAEVIAISHLFNIEGIISLPSLNTSIYTSSSLSASSTGSPSRPPSTSSTKGLSSPSPTDVPKSVAPKSSTSTNNQLYSGLGIAGGLFFLLSIIVFGIYFLVKRSRKRRSESEKQSKHLSTKPFEHNSSTAAETISFKSELPTLFNVPRAMRSTFLVKYELPGAENELPSAPYELSAESSSRFNR